MFFGCRNFGYGEFGGYWGETFMAMISLALIGVFIYIVFKLLNKLRYSEGKNKNQAMNILMERYARDEISEEEYLNKKKLIEK